MSDPAALAKHPQAGSVEPTWLGVRLGEATAPLGSHDAAPVTARARLTPGVQRLGPLELRADFEPGGEAASVAVELHNPGGQELAVESVVVGFRWRDHGLRALRFLRHGWQSWSYTGARPLDDRGEPPFPSGSWLRGMHHAVGEPPPDRQGWHESDLLTAIGASPSGPVLVAGVLEQGRSFGVVYARREGDAVLVEVELRLDARFAAGERLALEPVRVALGLDPEPLLEEHAEAHGRAGDARVARPFLTGWCSWYHFFHDVGEDDVRRNLEALVAARPELGVDVIQIDDGYQRAVGDWRETNERFPSGIAALAREIREAGFIAGLWTAPFCVTSESEIFAAHRDWLLTREGEPFRGLLHPQWARDASVYVLDPSRDDVGAHLRDLYRDLAAMGFGYLKLDFLYTAAMCAGAADPGLPRAARLRRGLEAIRSGAGDAAFLLGCGCPLGAAVGVVDGMRIGPDVAPRWRVAPEASIPGLEETAPATRSAVRSVLARTFMHRRLWLNDPDCLMASEGPSGGAEALSPEERRSLAVVIAATGGLALFSDDLPTLSPERRRLIRDTLACARDVDGLGLPGGARTLGLLESEIARGVVARSALGGYVACVNADDGRESRRLNLASLDLAPVAGTPEPLLGSRKSPGIESQRLEVELAAHDAALFQVRRSFPLAVFCDFDGTFSIQDVGSTLAQRHAGDRRPAAWARYERGEITAWDYNMLILDQLALPLRELEAFLETVDLDPGARALVEWCRRRRIPFRVLSDGFDYNLNRLQVLHDVSFAYDANHLRYEDEAWRIRGGHRNPDCQCGTGTCKRGRIDAFRAEYPDATIVHIGNGRVSDLCGALAADVAFAKDTLAEELARRGQPFEAFSTLREVIPRLEALLPRPAA